MPEEDGGFASPGDFFASALGSLRNNHERKRVIDQLRLHEAMLQSVRASAIELLRSRDFDGVMPTVLGLLCRAAGIARAQIFENRRGSDGRLAARLRCEWHGPDKTALSQDPFWQTLDFETALPEAWRDLLAKGDVVSAPISGLTAALGEACAAAGIRSLMVSSIMVNGGRWGELAFGDDSAEPHWQSDGIGAIKALAELIGGWIARRQPEREMEYAARISTNSPTVLFSIAAEENWPLTYVSPNVARYGYDARVLLEASTSSVDFVHPEDRGPVRDDIRRILRGGADNLRFEYRVRAADGNYRWSESHVSAVRAADGWTLGLDGTLSDIEDRHRLEQRMSELARTDILTGLANRASFLDGLSQAFAAAKRGGTSFAVLYLDLDGFKDVNDGYGHPMGDLLLQTAAERLKKTVRSADLVARLGGDEFAVLQANVSDPEGAGALSAKIGAELAVPYDIGGQQAQVTVSIGIAPYTPDTRKPADIIAQADMALYRSKDEGGNQYRFHSKELDAQVHERIRLANELRSAVGRNELELYYQPQVELASGRIAGMEALVRWNHPQRGQLKPGLFVPIAEKTGGIQALGHWVLMEAVRQFVRWRGLGIAPSFIALNLSAAQLKIRPEIEERVTQDLKSTGIDPSAVELELTEAALMEALRAREASLDRLRALGLRIAVDDFGTGYSSLESLRDKRVSRLKIASRYVRAMMTDPGSAAIVRATISLARELGIESAAQGVEGEDQLAALADAGCRYLQGFYFSEPVAAERATRLLQLGTLEPAGRKGAGQA